MIQRGRGRPSLPGDMPPAAWESHLARSRAASAMMTRPFAGVSGALRSAPDGYRLAAFAIGAREMRGPYSTRRILDFILGHPRDEILVGHSITYLLTAALRGIGEDTIDYLLDHDWGRWGVYSLQYRPGSGLTVALVDPRHRVVAGSSRALHEISGYWRRPLLTVLGEEGAASGADIVTLGAARQGGTHSAAVLRAAGAIERAAVARLMTGFRAGFAGLPIRPPRRWGGPGALAGAAHWTYGTPRASERPRREEWLVRDAARAYYGGRMESVFYGRVGSPVYHYDMRSAYAWALAQLPCPAHTRWLPFLGPRPPGGEGALWYGMAEFAAAAGPIGPLPVRRDGRITYPLAGAGVWYSPEIGAARRAGCAVTVSGGAWARTLCDCEPWGWVGELYRHRASVAPAKLILAALYGKFLQRTGTAPYYDLIAAGLITSLVRARVFAAAHSLGDRLIMIATDAIFAGGAIAGAAPLGNLGGWRETLLPDLFIVQPGIWWSGTLPAAAAGVPRSDLAPYRGEFESAWARYMESGGVGDPPAVEVVRRLFVGHRLARHWGRPHEAGSWSDQRARVSFGWSPARRSAATPCGAGVVTSPRRGGAARPSQGFDPDALSELRLEQLIREAQPDFRPTHDGAA